MAAPNLLALTTVYGRTGSGILTAASVALIANGAASNKLLKVSALYLANQAGLDRTVTVTLFDASTGQSRFLADAIVLPADASIVIIDKNGTINLEEGDEIRGLASVITSVDWVASWEELG